MKETAVREALRRLRKVQGEMQFASGMMPLDRQIERLRLSLGKLERAIYGRPKNYKKAKGLARVVRKCSTDRQDLPQRDNEVASTAMKTRRCATCKAEKRVDLFTPKGKACSACEAKRWDRGRRKASEGSQTMTKFSRWGR